MPKSLARVQDSAKRSRWTPDKARAVLAALENSGLSVQEFAKREGLDEMRLYRWRRRLREMTVAVPTFVEIDAAARRSTDGPIEIVLRSGHRLLIRNSCDVAALRQLLDLLEHGVEC